MDKIFQYIQPNMTTTLIVGVVIGIIAAMVIDTVGGFIERHWKSVLLICAITITVAQIV